MRDLNVFEYAIFCVANQQGGIARGWADQITERLQQEESTEKVQVIHLVRLEKAGGQS